MFLVGFSSAAFELYEQDFVSQGNPKRKVPVCAIMINCYSVDVQCMIQVLLTEMQLALT